MQDFAGKIAFVTGGASGIGLGLAGAFARRKMKVVIADIEESTLGPAAEGLKSAGADVTTMVVDVADRASVEDAAERTVSTLGGVHVVCNNAGVVVTDPVGETDPLDWKWIIDVNLRGVVHGMEAFGPRMIKQAEGGHIVNTASIAGLVSMPGYGPYCATKSAVVGMSEAYRKQLEPFNIGVSVLCPGAVKTQIFDSRRNQQQQYGGDRGGFRGDEEDRKQVEAGIPPEVLAEYVIESIEQNEAYIITHGEFRPFLEQRYKMIMDALEAGRTSKALAGLPKREVPGFRV